MKSNTVTPIAAITAITHRAADNAAAIAPVTCSDRTLIFQLNVAEITAGTNFNTVTPEAATATITLAAVATIAPIAAGDRPLIFQVDVADISVGTKTNTVTATAAIAAGTATGATAAAIAPITSCDLTRVLK